MFFQVDKLERFNLIIGSRENWPENLDFRLTMERIMIPLGNTVGLKLSVANMQ